MGFLQVKAISLRQTIAMGVDSHKLFSGLVRASSAHASPPVTGQQVELSAIDKDHTHDVRTPFISQILPGVYVRLPG